MNNWNSYPENSPDSDGEYFITIQNGNKKYVTISKFEKFTKLYNDNVKYYGPAWQDLNLGGTHINVIAFMELPEPY